MSTLVLPVAGQSSRFPGMRPKWLLTMPDGKLMLEKSVEKLVMSDFGRVVVVCLREHLDAYLSGTSLKTILTGIGHPNVDVCILDEPTSSQSETVALALERTQVQGPFFVKDCDNVFNLRWSGGNEIAVLDLNSVSLIDAKSKSYVNADAIGNVYNIVEKQVISNLFCCGGYGFSCANLFLKHFHEIKSENEVFISHIIYSMLMNGENFKINHANSYIDWGTLREYRHYARSFITLFCDVDGVLLHNGSKFGKNGWDTGPIPENLQAIARLQREGRMYLIITSSRPESEIENLESKLSVYGVRPHRYIMGLPHTRRVLVNDYSLTNPYPTAISVNLERDSGLLSSILDSVAE